jgi:hypothetical protein
MTWRLTHSKGPGRRHETHERRDDVDELKVILRPAPSINIGVCATPISLPCRDHPVRRPCLSIVESQGVSNHGPQPRRSPECVCVCADVS